MKKACTAKMILISIILITGLSDGYGQFRQTEHRALKNDEIPVSAPGYYGRAGKTYVLVNDLISVKSTLFLGKDVTLDLNGYTLSYADGDYEHLDNYSFERGLEGWDISKAPGAKTEDTKVQVMIGETVLRLKAGDEITSAYVKLPVENRSYFAMCGVSSPEMKVSIFVEDSLGTEIKCVTNYGKDRVVSCPADNLSPRLGGGILYAHLTDLPAGRYRVRIKAITDCFIDYVDIRPALDVGIGIAEKIQPWVSYNHLFKDQNGAFFDYAGNDLHTELLKEIPVVTGKGTVTIKNGTIRNGTEGILSWGIQSTATDVVIILDNIKIETSGINTNAVNVPQAVITNCSFDVNNPFIINRHGSSGYGVDLWGKGPSEVSWSEFFGGQGCLVFKGDFSKVHHNFFANRQSVTNHYSIMAMGDSSLIFSNKIIPETGSGIEIYVHRGMEIFDNTIKIQASPPTCEYGHTDYSTTALRIADYNQPAGSPNGAYGNRFYNNKIYVTGFDYEEYPDYVPMAWAVFYSASGGENYIFGNEVFVSDSTPSLKNETSAFYIGGGSNGGVFEDNRITTNVPAFWVASRYGSAQNVKITGNRIIKSGFSAEKFSPVRMGWYNNIARNIEFRSNIIEGSDFKIDKTEQEHSYSVSWTIRIKVTDKRGNPVEGTEVKVMDSKGIVVINTRTGDNGIIEKELLEYTANGKSVTSFSPYTVISGNRKYVVNLDKNQEILITK
jgi:hypothetical protein